MSKRADEMTYTPCPACRGKLFVDLEGCGNKRRCPCVDSGTPGWAPTGATLHQIDRLIDMERAMRGDPSMSAKRQSEVLEEIRVKLVDALKREGA